MIGDGWDNDPALRPSSGDGEGLGPPLVQRALRVAVVTGTRAEFGLLRPVMHAVAAHPDLELQVIVAGSHLIPPAPTFREVKAEFVVADTVPMQKPGKTTRLDDAEALGRGIARFARSFGALRPDWVVVLGDRIEAFAAASAASVAGIAMAHIHGGDRAEGVADEAMRHAITKLAHLHLVASEASGARVRAMGEPEERVIVTGSPALDDLGEMPELDDAAYTHFGRPAIVMLLHPIGRHAEDEELTAAMVLEACAAEAGERSVLALHPNHDPGRDGIVRALLHAGAGVNVVEHLPRANFVGLLRRVAREGGALVGNSSAGLIEAAAVGCPALDVGPRQAGRERAANVVTVPSVRAAGVDGLRSALQRARGLLPDPVDHPWAGNTDNTGGAGHAAVRIASALASATVRAPGYVRKRNVY